MNILSFRVSKFRNIVDSGPIALDESVTCLVGKNEAGKSALIEALYLFNPAHGELFNVEEQYPRWLLARDRRSNDLNSVTPISITFELEEIDHKAVSELLGDNVLRSKQISVSRKYDGGSSWGFEHNERNAVKNLSKKFPDSIQHLISDFDTVESIQKALDETTPTDNDDSHSSEDLKSAKNILQDIGLNEKSVCRLIVDILESRLPRFFRFTSYSTLPGRIDFREIASSQGSGPAQNGLQTARALLELTGTDINQLENDNYELRTGELEAVQIDLTRQVFEYWQQNPDLEVLIDVDKETVTQGNNRTAVARFLDIRLRDKRTGYSNNFRQRSSGFQWFFSFFAAFSEFDENESPVILLDEPALNLHGKAQADFLRFINERLAPVSPVIYTTHSPFMVESDKLDRVRIVEDKGPPEGAICREDAIGSEPDSLFPLQAALGYDIAQNLFVGPHNLVVEGTSDYIYLTVMSSMCRATNRVALDERWRILPAGGATNIPTFVTLIGPHLDITVLADSDTKGMQRVNNMIHRNLLQDRRLIFVSEAINSEHADIEDLFSSGDYIKLYNKTFHTHIKINELPKGNRIVKRIEIFTGTSFDHGLVAETFLREHQSLAFSDTSYNRFSSLFIAINRTIDT